MVFFEKDVENKGTKEIILPQLRIVVDGSNRARFLKRLPSRFDALKAKLTFKKDEHDPRIISIRYKTPNKDMDRESNSIMYYSEEFNKHVILTSNLGYDYDGRIVVKDFNNHKLGVSLEHISQDIGIKKKHLERIENIPGIRKDLTPEYVSARYRKIFYSLPEFLKI